MTRAEVTCVRSLSILPTVDQQKSIFNSRSFLERWYFLFLALSVLSLAGPGLAQTDPAAGILPFSTLAGGQYDSIDLATSNILIIIPIRSKAGTIPLNFNLTENNRIYKNPGSSNGPTLSQAIIHTGGTEYMSVNMNARLLRQT